MEEQPLKPAPSFTSTMANVFTTPGEAFGSLVGTESSVMQWLAPMIVSFVLVIASVYLISHNETLRQQLIDTQRAAMEKLVAEGRLTQEQFDAQMDRLEGGSSSMFIIFGTIFGTIFTALFYFAGALFLWLANKFILKSAQPYGTHLELYGVASWISILGGMITLLMMVGMGSIYASPGGSLAVLSSFDATSKLHRLLSSLNIFTVWQVVVIGVGLGKFSGKSSGLSIGIAFALWAVWVVLSLFLRIGG
ncbi:MAG: YIP1 family protein [Ignavibacteriales bacterium]|nr:YIP1 family protein [Ignavibacteriales bacterium]